MTDYKKYSLEQVENFLYDAMSTDATPQEIYDVIKGVVQDNYYTYKNSTEKAYELLALLNGNGKGHIKEYDDCMRPWGHSDMEALQYTEEELNAMCDKAASKCPDIYHDQMIDAGYVKSANGLWVHPVLNSSTKTDKVKKWILPVDDDYNITFPEDFLEQTGWKEGDTLEWHDQGDGSFKLTKQQN
jgi:hypothetical protein